MNASRKFALFSLIVLAATILYAQDKPKKGESELRTVRGTVVDKDETPVETAVVYLKNNHTQDITTHLSEPDGQFRFTGLDLNVDYEIHAEHEDMTSSTRTISSFDSRRDIEVNLKVSRQKKQ